uniref:Uncharacterized protein n=1 Tax=Alexandrium monilatum TaxID=311494 RepID=A0A7S4RDY3_9DINO
METTVAEAGGARSSPVRPRLSCGRDWEQRGGPLSCRIQLAAPLRGPLRQADPVSAVARVCTAAGCQRRAFSMGAVRSGPTADVLAEGSFAVPMDDALASRAAGEEAPVLKLAVEVARLRLGAELLLEQLLPEVEGDPGSPAAVPGAAGGSAEERQLTTEMEGGVLRLSASLALPGYGPPPPAERDAEEGGDRGAASARIEVGRTTKDGPRGPRMEDVSFVLSLEPHLGRWARLICTPPTEAEDELDNGPDTSAEGCALAEGPAAWGAALPLAVAASAELGEEALLPHQGQGPEPPAPDAGNGTAALAWRVPTVPLAWVLERLLPALAAPGTGRLSLALRRSATVGPAGGVLMSGLTAAQRARFAQLAVEWFPGDEPPCLELVQALYAEGFTRRGPLICEEGQQTLLSFKREVDANATEALSAGSWTALAGESLPGGLTAGEDGQLWAQSFPVAVQHRFSVSRVTAQAADANSSCTGFAVRLPSFYEVWVEANSPSASGSRSLGRELDGPAPEQVFLLTLEPRPRFWAAAQAGAGSADWADAVRWGLLENRPVLPPGWAHPRHFVLPASAFPPPAPAAEEQGVTPRQPGQALEEEQGAPPPPPPPPAAPLVPLSWALSWLLGERDVALLVLRDAVFSVRPWAAAGRLSRSFRRVRLEATGDAADAAMASSCFAAVRWAVRLGYSLLQGDCPGRGANSSGTPELLFERLGK